MTEEITKAPEITTPAAAATSSESRQESRTSKELSSGDLLGSQRVYKKSSPNSMLTIYIPTRELVSQNGCVTPLRGVLYGDPKFVLGHRVFGQLTLTFRYGREDEEVMGLRFCNEAVMCLSQIWPPPENKIEETLTPLQDALVKRLGEGAHPFTMHVTAQAPPSVQLVPAKRYYGAPIGTSYDIRCYVGESPQLIISSQYNRDTYDDDKLTAERSEEKFHRRSTVRMGIRLIHKTDNVSQVQAPEHLSSSSPTAANNTPQSNGQSLMSPPPFSSAAMSNSTDTPSTHLPPLARGSRTERMESFSKLKLSPKAFRFTGKLCRSKSEIEKRSSDFFDASGCALNEFESTRGGPQGSVDKPFLLQEGKVGLKASLDKSIYKHGENIIVTVDIRNDSRKTVRRIRVSAIQHVDVCMFSNGKFKNIVAESDPNSSEITVKPSGILHKTYSLQPQRGPTKNWIALEDSLQRSNEPNAITALIAASALRQPPASAEDRNVFAIYVSYYVKVKLTLSGMGGELSLKLPFTLVHIDRQHSSENNHDNEIKAEQADKSPCGSALPPHPHPPIELISPPMRHQTKLQNDDGKTIEQICSSLSSSVVVHSSATFTTTATSSSIIASSPVAPPTPTATTSSTHLDIDIIGNQAKKSNQSSSTSVAGDVIDQLRSVDDISVDCQNSASSANNKTRRMLRNVRHNNTIEISSIDEDRDDLIVVGTTAHGLLDSSESDLRTAANETTCVEVHATSS